MRCAMPTRFAVGGQTDLLSEADQRKPTALGHPRAHGRCRCAASTPIGSTSDPGHSFASPWSRKGRNELELPARILQRIRARRIWWWVHRRDHRRKTGLLLPDRFGQQSGDLSKLASVFTPAKSHRLGGRESPSRNLELSGAPASPKSLSGRLLVHRQARYVGQPHLRVRWKPSTRRSKSRQESMMYRMPNKRWNLAAPVSVGQVPSQYAFPQQRLTPNPPPSPTPLQKCIAKCITLGPGGTSDVDYSCVRDCQFQQLSEKKCPKGQVWCGPELPLMCCDDCDAPLPKCSPAKVTAPPVPGGGRGSVAARRRRRRRLHARGSLLGQILRGARGRSVTVGHKGKACCASCASGGTCEGEKNPEEPWWKKAGHCCESCALGKACEGGCGDGCTCGKEGKKTAPNPVISRTWRQWAR